MIFLETLVDTLAWNIDGSCLIIGDRQVEVTVIKYTVVHKLSISVVIPEPRQFRNVDMIECVIHLFKILDLDAYTF